MHCLLPITLLLIPLALAFPKWGHHSEPEPLKLTSCTESTKATSAIAYSESTIFPTLTITSSGSGAFPTGVGLGSGTGTGTVLPYPTAFPTGILKRRRAVPEGRKFKGFGYLPSGTIFKPTGFPFPTSKPTLKATKTKILKPTKKKNV